MRKGPPTCVCAHWRLNVSHSLPLGLPSGANIFPYDQKAYLNVKERKRLPLCVLSVPTEPNNICFPLVGIPATLMLTYTQKICSHSRFWRTSFQTNRRPTIVSTCNLKDRQKDANLVVLRRRPNKLQKPNNGKPLRPSQRAAFHGKAWYTLFWPSHGFKAVHSCNMFNWQTS